MNKPKTDAELLCQFSLCNNSFSLKEVVILNSIKTEIKVL